MTAMEYGCDRHTEVMDCLDDMDDRIKYLELSDNEIKTELKNLMLRVDRLCETIERYMSGAWKTLIACAAVGVGFVIWYIQDLPH